MDPLAIFHDLYLCRDYSSQHIISFFFFSERIPYIIFILMLGVGMLSIQELK